MKGQSDGWTILLDVEAAKSDDGDRINFGNKGSELGANIFNKYGGLIEYCQMSKIRRGS